MPAIPYSTLDGRQTDTGTLSAPLPPPITTPPSRIPSCVACVIFIGSIWGLNDLAPTARITDSADPSFEEQFIANAYNNLPMLFIGIPFNKYNGIPLCSRANAITVIGLAYAGNSVVNAALRDPLHLSPFTAMTTSVMSLTVLFCLIRELYPRVYPPHPAINNADLFDMPNSSPSRDNVALRNRATYNITPGREDLFYGVLNSIQILAIQGVFLSLFYGISSELPQYIDPTDPHFTPLLLTPSILCTTGAFFLSDYLKEKYIASRQEPTQRRPHSTGSCDEAAQTTDYQLLDEGSKDTNKCFSCLYKLFQAEPKIPGRAPSPMGVDPRRKPENTTCVIL